MMGTAILVMPSAIAEAGLVGGILSVVIMAGIGFYTAYRILNCQAHAGKC